MNRVRLFAAAAEAAGTDTVTLTTTPDGAPPTLAGLREQLAERFGDDFTQVLQRCAVLVDGARLADDEPVPTDATVDVLPPFAGG
ncbi:MAG TPA: MoaD/ThiS family protein [Humibacter sp.]|jgi:molybdopterin converting factor small subunit|nr:MoaD/ThiS family protein [Humibacter sp.]